VKYRTLDEVAGRLERKHISFSELMSRRVRNIMLVSSMYDSFTFQEDGSLNEMLFSEYLELNLRYAPVISRVSTAGEAIAQIKENPPDMVITMPRVGEMEVVEFGQAVREIAPDMPLVLLAYDTRELALLKARESLMGVDRIFVWQGDALLFLAIIKWAEDRMNARHDAEVAGVKSIILIEDSVRFYSAYLPLLYTEIVEQTQALMAEGINRMQKLLRMRARPKILLATSYEEGEALFRDYREHVLGIVVDARFPRNGRTDPEAGSAFIRMVKDEDPDTPVLMQSREAENEAVAASLGVPFIHKGSQTLLHRVRDFLRTHLGFGDFVFRRPNGAVVATARDLRGLVERLKIVPDDCLLHHACRNDFSTWLRARTEFDLAKALRPRKAEEFRSPADLREYLLAALSRYRSQTMAGQVAEFSRETFEAGLTFTKIGNGSLGGKGRGLAFINSLLNAYDIQRHVEGVHISVPPSAVVATGIFDQFIEGSGLAPLALGEASDEEIRRAFLAARLPGTAVDALRAFLSRVRYPLAVRSSSLLEDSSHQPFAGIYRTYMLPNNSPDLKVRLGELCRAIQLVYASTYYADSKSYVESTPNRLEEEKMAIVIQQVVGRRHGEYIYPDIAGVARSYDFYPMRGLHAEDGVASVALGLGRTVVDGERCVRFSPAQPNRLYQFASTQDYLKNSQRQFYALDLSKPGPGDALDAGSPDAFADPADSNLAQLGIEAADEHGSLAAVGSIYSPENDTVYEGVHRKGVKLITMAGVLSGDHFPLPETLQFLMEVGKAGFSCNVEIEFAVNLRADGEGPQEFAFLQIRPLVFGVEPEEINLPGVAPARAICISDGALGHGYLEGVRDLVFVKPDTFDRSKTAEIAAEVGAVNARLRGSGRPYLLIGPGRWGSADHWLGIPVTWAQIAGVRCIVEAEMEDIKVAPSQGTHFFQNITSFGIVYFTLRSEDPADFLDYR
jgi:DNA-binding NarL/FixJ family response regulator